MPAIAPPPEPVAITAHLDGNSFLTQVYAEGPESRLVFGNRRAVYKEWYGLSEYLNYPTEDTTPSDESSDELPAVLQFPIVRTVRTRFYDAGRHQPLPFPDSDD